MVTATHDPANPVKNDCEFHPGLSAREYAAIKLRVPDSGTEWLDAMIRKSLRDDFAAKLMQSFVATPDEIDRSPGETFFDVMDDLSESAYQSADAMLRARDA